MVADEADFKPALWRQAVRPRDVRRRLDSPRLRGSARQFDSGLACNQTRPLIGIAVRVKPPIRCLHCAMSRRFELFWRSTEPGRPTLLATWPPVFLSTARGSSLQAMLAR